MTSPSVSALTLQACVQRGWLSVSDHDDIYQRRWTITEAGRTALAKEKP
jgi:hypothetical protein